MALIFVAMIAAVIRPNFPSSTKEWLTAKKLFYVQHHLFIDAREADDADAIMLITGIRTANRDYRLDLLVLLQHLSLLSQPTQQYFFLSIVGTLRYG